MRKRGVGRDGLREVRRRHVPCGEENMCVSRSRQHLPKGFLPRVRSFGCWLELR